MRGMGAHVKNTVMRRKNFLPQMSDRAPIRGAERKESRPKSKNIYLPVTGRKLMVAGHAVLFSILIFPIIKTTDKVRPNLYLF